MSKHTPGPWRADDETDGFQGMNHIPIWAHEDVGEHRLAEVQPHFNEARGDFQFTEEDWANARLIATAPELIDLLQEIHDYTLENQDKALSGELFLKLVNLISKAVD